MDLSGRSADAELKVIFCRLYKTHWIDSGRRGSRQITRLTAVCWKTVPPLCVLAKTDVRTANSAGSGRLLHSKQEICGGSVATSSFLCGRCERRLKLWPGSSESYSCLAVFTLRECTEFGLYVRTKRNQLKDVYTTLHLARSGVLQFEGLVRAAKVYTSTKMNVGASEKVLNWFNSCYFTLSCQRCKVSGSVQSEPGSNRTLTSSCFIIHFSLNGIVNDWIYTVFYRPVIRKLISS